MKIIKFAAENFKRLVAVEITPDGNLVEIAGKNRQGKTSILDAIWVALGGLEAAPTKPIRAGELEATITLTLGTDKPEMIVTRTFRPTKDGTDITSSLKVENAEGAKYGSPQALLDKLLGSLAFDPLAFDRMDAKAQFNTLRAFVPGVDFEALDMATRADYDKRSAANRKAKEAHNAAALIRVATPIGTRIDEAALIADLENAGKVNTDIETRKANRERIRSEVASLETSILAELGLIAECEDKMKGARERLQGYHKVQAEKQARLDAAAPLQEPVDTTAIREKLQAAKLTNASIDEAQRAIVRRDEHIAVAKAQDAISAQLSEAIDMREVNKRKAIAEAKLPIDGISFGDNEVLLRAVPWSQASDAERLVASMQMAMAMNPKLRIVRVRDGSLLDEDSKKIVAEMAAAQDYQVWMEVVGVSGNVGVVIEDGRVKSQPKGVA